MTRAVTVEARAVLDLPAACFLPWFVPRSPVGLFPAWGPIPGVVAVHDQRGAWTTPGSRRVLEMSDGSRTQEEVVAFDPPGFFADRMSGFTGVMARLVTAIEGEWRCTMRADGCVAVNDGEIFERHLGRNMPIALQRGLNDLRTRGGLMYAPPVR